MPDASETILIVDDDVEVTEGLSMALTLGRKDRLIITCNDVESAQVVLERVPVTAMITDVRFSGPFAFEGLDMLRFVLEKCPDVRILLMSGNFSPELEGEALRRGARAFLHKPFGIASLEQLLENVS